MQAYHVGRASPTGTVSLTRRMQTPGFEAGLPLGAQGRSVPPAAVLGALRRARGAAADVAGAQRRLAERAGRPKRSVPSICADPAALHNVARCGCVPPSSSWIQRDDPTQ